MSRRNPQSAQWLFLQNICCLLQGFPQHFFICGQEECNWIYKTLKQLMSRFLKLFVKTKRFAINSQQPEWVPMSMEGSLFYFESPVFFCLCLSVQSGNRSPLFLLSKSGLSCLTNHSWGVLLVLWKAPLCLDKVFRLKSS